MSDEPPAAPTTEGAGTVDAIPPGMGAEEQREDEPLVVRVGPIVVDVPQTLGFYGGLAAAVALELIGPEIGLFIAAVPVVKMLRRRRATRAERAVTNVFKGAMKPVGGDAEAVVRPAWVEEEKRRAASENGRLHAGLGHRLGLRLRAAFGDRHVAALGAKEAD